MEILSRLESLAADFDAMRQTHAAFVDACEGWVADKLSQLKDEKAKHIKTLAANKDKEATFTHQIQLESSKVTSLTSIADTERSVQALKEASNLDLTRTLATLEKERDALDAEVSALENNIALKKTELGKCAGERVVRVERSVPEVKFFEEKLGMRIEPIDEGVLKFVFTQINQYNWDEECYFVLDVSSGGKEYKMRECKPDLPTKQQHIDFLNESRDVFRFVKEMRNGFSQFGGGKVIVKKD